MPLGIGRASEYAGWWTGKPKMGTIVSTALNSASPWLVTPRYYQDNSATGFAGAGYGSPSSPSVGLIDTTGLVNNPNYVTAMTIRFGTDYLATAPGGIGTQGGIWYDRYWSAGTDYYPNVGLQKDPSGNYVWGVFPGDAGSATNHTIVNFNSTLRNTWLSFVTAVSISSSNFANWTGTGTDSFYVRTAVVNVETGQLLQLMDGTAGGTIITKNTSQNWYFDNTGSSSYGYAPFWYTDGGNWDLYGRTDWDLAGIWHAWAAVDPGVYYAQLSGSAISATVGSLTSTAQFQFTGPGSRTTGDDGFTFAFGANGSRMPSDVVYTVDSNQGTSTNSSALVSF